MVPLCHRGVVVIFLVSRHFSCCSSGHAAVVNVFIQNNDIASIRRAASRIVVPMGTVTKSLIHFFGEEDGEMVVRPLKLINERPPPFLFTAR